MKESIVPQAAHIQVFIDFRYIASPPQVHQAMDLVDQRWRWGAGCIVPQTGAFTLRPWLQLHSAAGAFLRLFISILVTLLDICLTASTRQEIVARGESGIGEATGDSVEDAWPNGRTLYAKVIAMQQVVGGHIVQSAHRVHTAVVRKHPPDYKVYHYAPHMAQEL